MLHPHHPSLIPQAPSGLVHRCPGTDNQTVNRRNAMMHQVRAITRDDSLRAVDGIGKAIDGFRGMVEAGTLTPTDVTR